MRGFFVPGKAVFMKPQLNFSRQLLLQKLRTLAASRYALFLIFLLAYTKTLEFFGGLPSLLPAWRLEIPLLLYVYAYLNRITRPSRLQPWLTAAPPVLFYVVFDLFFFNFGRLLRIVEALQLPEMFNILPVSTGVMALTVVGVPLLVLLVQVRWCEYRTLILGAVPLAVLIIGVEQFPSQFMTFFETTQDSLVFWSDKASTANNGRISMMLYNEAKRNSSLEKTSGFKAQTPFLDRFDKTAHKVAALKKKRNVHIVVLESFLEPDLFKAAKYSQNPMHPEFAKLLGGKGSFSISPVFGGSTAQAEFEVLCGVPALRELSGIEFDMFTGAKTACLPNLLAQGGYEALATNAYVPEFFNSVNAYKGIGFDKVYYPREYAPQWETYLSTGELANEGYMFDGDLLRQNLAFVEQHLKNPPSAPLLNYVLSMYGHLPHDINLEKRPMVIGVDAPVKDDQFERAVNQYYYRTEAIASYVKKLAAIDRNSLIVLISDHLPPLSGWIQGYGDLKYLPQVEDNLHVNRVFFIENGRPVRFNTIRHYDVPEIVLNFITKGDYCRDNDCSFARGRETKEEQRIDKMVRWDDYMTIMSRAMM